MKSVCIIDTSVFLEIIEAPGKTQQSAEIQRQLKRHIEDSVALILPLAAVIETGNHIAQARSDGSVRRKAAERFCKAVQDTINNCTPWTLTGNEPWQSENLRVWLDQFPDAAMRGQGIADLSIVEEWKIQRQRNQSRRVFIWSLDQHLQGYDTGNFNSG